MRVVFMGTPDFSVGTLKAIISAGHDVVGVVTQPDKPKGRGKELLMTPVKEEALKHNIEVFQPVRVRKDEEFLSKLEKLRPDVIVVVAFGQLLPKRVLDIPKYGCVNVHASILPMYRGAAPLQWAIINGEKVSGVTTQQMNEGLDTGDILLKKEIAIDPKETYGSYYEKAASEGAELLVETLAGLEAGTITPITQSGDTCYASLIDKSMGNLDFGKSATELERLIRGLNPWPSAFSYLEGKCVKFWDADVVSEDELVSKYGLSLEFVTDKEHTGEVAYIDKTGFLIITGEGALKINELQIEGKKRMDAASFLRGYRLNAGDRFTSER